MNLKISVSVIIPTFNRLKLIRRAIESVMNQNVPANEIIVIDDGSTDGTGDLIMNNYPAIKYFRQENKGISAARNMGIQKSNGNWIAFLDSDDEWLPDKLEKQKYAINIDQEFQICHTNEIWIRNGRRVNQKNKHQKFGGEIFDKCLPLCVISPSSVIVNKEVFENYGLFDENLPACEDYDMWLRLCAFLPVLYLEEPLIKKYGGHADQLSQKHWGMDRFRINALEKIIAEPKLDELKRKSAIKMLVEKLDIFLNGLKKRNKLTEMRKYQSLKEKYTDLLLNQ